MIRSRSNLMAVGSHPLASVGLLYVHGVGRRPGYCATSIMTWTESQDFFNHIKHLWNILLGNTSFVDEYCPPAAALYG